MTTPGGGGRNLNPLWVPLLGEASQLNKTIEEAAHKARETWTRVSQGISQPFHQGVSEGMRQAADDMDQHSKRGAQAVQQNLGAVAGRVAAMWTEGFHLAEEGFEKVLDLGKEAVEQFVEIGEQWEVVTRTLRARTTAIGPELEGLQNTVGQIGRNTSASFNSIAEAVGVLHQRTGLGGEALKQLATDVVDAQKVFGQPIDVTRFTGAIRAYGGNMEEADKILNQLAATSRATGTPLNELIDSVYRGGPTMRQFGVEIGPATALLAQMNEHGIRSQSAIFALNRSMTEAAKAGLPFEDFLKNSVARVRDLYNVGDEAGAQDLAIKIFGARGGSSIATAIQDNALSVESLEQAFTNLGSTGGERISDLYESTRTLGDRFEELKHQAADSLRPFTEHVFGEIGPAFQHMNEWIGDHEATVAKFFVGVGDLAGAAAEGIVEVTARIIEAGAKALPILAEIDRAGATVADALGKHDYAEKSRAEADHLDAMVGGWDAAAKATQAFADKIGHGREEFRNWGAALEENLRLADTFNQVLTGSPDGHELKFKTNAPDVKAELDSMGLNIQQMQDADHTIVITASTAEGADKVKEWVKETEAKNVKVVTLPNPHNPQGETWNPDHPQDAFPGIEKGIPVPVVPMPSVQGGPGGPVMPSGPGPGLPGAPGPGAPFGAPPTNVPGVPATPAGMPPMPGPGGAMPPMPGPPGAAPPGHPGGPAAPAPPAAPGTPTGESETVSEIFGNWQRLTKPDGSQWWVNHDDKDEKTGQGPIIDPQSLKPPEGFMWMQTAPHVNVLTRTGAKAGAPPARPAYTARPGQGPINNQPIPPGPVATTSGSPLLDSTMGLPDWYVRLQQFLGGGINSPINNPSTIPGTSTGSDGRQYQVQLQDFSTALPPASATTPGGRPPYNLPPDQDNPGTNRLLAWQIYNQMGMPLDQWDDFERLEMSEAGYRATAKNPSSTAYGMGQFLDSTFKDYGQPPTGTADPTIQLQLMMQYLKNKFHGSPSEAWRFHLANNYYAQGSWVSGGAGGIDDVPAWLTEGEFVVRKESAQKWAPVLEWINTHGHGNPPQATRGFNEGDEVTNPVSPFTGGQIDPSMYSSTQEFIHAWNLARFLGETMTGHAKGGSIRGYQGGGDVEKSLWQRYISGEGIFDPKSLMPPILQEAFQGHLPSYSSAAPIAESLVSYPLAAAGSLVGYAQRGLSKVPGIGGLASQGNWAHDWSHPWDIPGRSTPWWPTSYYKHAQGGPIKGYQGGGEVDPHDYGFTPEMFGSLEEYRNWYRLHGLIQHIEHMGYAEGGLIGDAASNIGPNPQTLPAWLIAAAHNVPGTGNPRWMEGMKVLVGRESHGDPNAVNRWDSNWKKGTPSIGLAQVIGPTAAQYGIDPSHLNQPIPNLIAAMRYIKDRYGDISNVQQANPLLPPKGYAEGGQVWDPRFERHRGMAQNRALSPWYDSPRGGSSWWGIYSPGPARSPYQVPGRNPFFPPQGGLGSSFQMLGFAGGGPVDPDHDRPQEWYDEQFNIMRLYGDPNNPDHAHALGGWIKGYQGGGAVATDTSTSSASATSGAYVDPNNPDVVDWLKQMVDMYNASTGSNLQITADRSGYAGNEPGDVGHPNEGGSSLHDVNRAVDIGGDPAQRAAFLRWWESDPNRVKATRQLIASGLPGLSPASTNIYAGDLYSHGGQNVTDIYGADTLAKHGDHIHLGLEGVPLFSPGMGAPSASTVGVPMGTQYSPSQYPGYVMDPSGKLIPQSQATGYGNFGGATQAEIASANSAVEQARQAKEDKETQAREADEDLRTKQTALDDVTQKRIATDEQISDAQTKATTAHREATDATNKYNEAIGKQTEVLNKPPDTVNQKLATAPGSSVAQAFGGSVISGLMQGLGFDDQVFSNPLNWGIWKLFTGGANFAGGLLQNIGKSPTGMFAPAGSPQSDPFNVLKGPFSSENNPLMNWGALAGVIPGIDSSSFQDKNGNAGIASAVTPAGPGMPPGPFGPPTGPAPGPAVDASVNIAYNGTVNQGLPSAEAVTSAQVTQSRAPGNPITSGGPVIR